jgi:hypothetical protein
MQDVYLQNPQMTAPVGEGVVELQSAQYIPHSDDQPSEEGGLGIPTVMSMGNLAMIPVDELQPDWPQDEEEMERTALVDQLDDVPLHTLIAGIEEQAARAVREEDLNRGVKSVGSSFFFPSFTFTFCFSFLFSLTPFPRTHQLKNRLRCERKNAICVCCERWKGEI